jgi:lambda repressor-like predicted transcriptional regulator
MHTGKLVFAQLMTHVPLTTFRRCVARYDGEHKVKQFSCVDQLLVMMFAQLTFRESLRDIEACLRAQGTKLYHMGIRGGIARNTLANANAVRDWRIYASFAQRLIATARRLYANEPLGVELKASVYALDATTIDLCLSLFPWAPFRSTKAAVKLHTLLDLRGNIPTFLYISDGKFHEVNILDQLIIEAGAFYVMDRGYLDFERFARIDQAGAFFVTRARHRLRFRCRLSRPTDRSTGLICDQTIELTVFYSKQGYGKALRRIRFKDPDSGKSLVFLTNNFALPASTICTLYRMRWQVELFFKWIKQHLRIKVFYGTSENAVKTQIWIAVCAYVLVAIVRKRLKLEASMHEILQILSLTLFEKTPLDELLTLSIQQSVQSQIDNQMNLLD